jgi:hypothetical protein
MAADERGIAVGEGGFHHRQTICGFQAREFHLFPPRESAFEIS